MGCRCQCLAASSGPWALQSRRRCANTISSARSAHFSPGALRSSDGCFSPHQHTPDDSDGCKSLRMKTHPPTKHAPCSRQTLTERTAFCHSSDSAVDVERTRRIGRSDDPFSPGGTQPQAEMAARFVCGALAIRARPGHRTSSPATRRRSPISPICVSSAALRFDVHYHALEGAGK